MQFIEVDDRYDSDLRELFEPRAARFLRDEDIHSDLYYGEAHDQFHLSEIRVCLPRDPREFWKGPSSAQMRITHPESLYVEQVEFREAGGVVYRQALLPLPAGVSCADDDGAPRRSLDLAPWIEVAFTRRRWERLVRALSSIACEETPPDSYLER